MKPHQRVPSKICPSCAQFLVPELGAPFFIEISNVDERRGLAGCLPCAFIFDVVITGAAMQSRTIPLNAEVEMHRKSGWLCDEWMFRDRWEAQSASGQYLGSILTDRAGQALLLLFNLTILTQ